MLIMKILGCLMVVISCSLIGHEKGIRYRRRYKNLGYLINCLRILETEIVFLSNPIGVALENIYKKCNKDVSYIFNDIAIDMKESRRCDLHESFRKVLSKNMSLIAFNKDDLEIFLSISRVLGISNRDDQKKHLLAISKQLSVQSQEAREEMIKKEKMYNKLGFLIGLGIAIILV